MQTMHPVVGAGVRDFSDFRADPWGRLERTLHSLQVQLFGGTRSVDEAQRLRALHKAIRGTGFDGAPYRALNPEAYAWVHLSNFDTLLSYHRWFGRPLGEHERITAYEEWKQVGRVLGIRDQFMPSDLSAFRAYVTEMVTYTLQDNATARDFLDSLRLSDIAAPSWHYFPEPLWRVLRPFGRQLLHDTTVGTLPPVLRRRLGMKWGPLDHGRLRGFALLVRTGSIPVPDRLLQYPLACRAQQEARRTTALRRAS
jgi:uncharacterized protein (DUF2236 family)